MGRLQWFRMYAEARTDAKLRSLSDAEFRVWFNLLCYAAESENQRGTVDLSDPFIVALEVAGGDEELLSRVCHALSRLRIVEERDGIVTFINFTRRQYDKPSDTPEKTRERKQKSRANTRDSGEKPPMSRDVTPGHAYTQIRKDNKDVGEGSPTSPLRAPAQVKAMPRNGPAQQLVASWYECAGGVPVNYGKAYGLGQKLVDLGATDEDIRELYRWMGEQDFFEGKFDLGTAVTQYEKFQQSKKPRRKASDQYRGVPA